MIEPRTLKGFRDFLPAEARKRQFMIATLKKVFESYGFEPLETPVLEYEEILAGKYGEEGEKLMYRFTDNGDRRVAMRYDQTVPLARVVAQYQNELPMPFKRYQIQNVWRAENTQKGRYREFVQCDIDTVGSSSGLSDAEVLALIYQAYSALGFQNIRILINDRSVFGDLPIRAITIIDKLKKIGEENVLKELAEIDITEDQFKAVRDAEVPNNLNAIIEQAKLLGCAETALLFDPTLARGLDYYTGIIIEVEIEGYSVGSVGGGGRYDNLVGMFTKNQFPAVGYAFGFDRTYEAMEDLGLFPTDLSAAQVLVTIFSPDLEKESVEFCSRLRSNNINVELYLDSTAKMDKQLKYADRKQIPYVAIIGPDEAREGKVTIKNLKTREQKTVKQDEAAEYLIKD